MLGIVSADYEVVENRDAFRFLDALIGSDLHFETAGSLWGGRRVWVLARRPEYIELGGDTSATYIYVANSHDGSMAVTAAVTPIRIVCANTLGAALRQAGHGVSARRTFRFRHTGNLAAKFTEARQVLGMTVDYEQQFKTLADRLARQPITAHALEHRVLRHLWVIDEDLGKAARRPPRADDRASARRLLRPGERRRHDRQQPRLEMGGVQRDRRTPGPRTALHQPDQSDAALLRGHRAQAARA